ncbi:hypothetical protein QM716_01175 [Rhodococcus sp. IEGM 1409]|uniref:hypothetical protein n=1 Tax=Rhodococcus sp. IEGM 1409 TaxID=3047082 RepID=UPI0024B8319A|nr:hypothetical protein [Rhodococcus sp. IEGM 1409]MDI9898459.1 hypothetical protein [Rhodococcus sp. IEGM 1409]
MPSIIPTSSDQVQDIARALLEAADSPDEVRTDTSGPRLAFIVSDELATKAGFGEYDDDPEPLPEPEPEPESVPVEEPPRSGKGSGEEAWKKFLNDQKFEFDPKLERNDLIALWDAHTGGQ